MGAVVLLERDDIKMAVQSPLVSVVIPCYKQAAFLPEAIESALGQDYRQIEVIVVDDGSPDDTSVIAEAYPVLCVRQENRGLAGARNTGLSRAKGEFIVFLDADDRLLAHAVGRGVEVMTANPQWAFTFGRYEIIPLSGNSVPMTPRASFEGDPYGWLLRYNWIGMHATVMYRREVLESIAGFDESLAAAEDYEVYLRIARQWPIGSHDGTVAQYRRHERNMSGRAALMLNAVLRVLEGQRTFVREHAARLSELRAGILATKHEYVLRSLREMMNAASLRKDHRLRREWLSVILRHGPSVLTLSLVRRGARLFSSSLPSK